MNPNLIKSKDVSLESVHQSTVNKTAEKLSMARVLSGGCSRPGLRLAGFSLIERPDHGVESLNQRLFLSTKRESRPQRGALSNVRHGGSTRALLEVPLVVVSGMSVLAEADAGDLHTNGTNGRELTRGGMKQNDS